MAMSSSSSAQPSGGKDPPQLAERFLLLDDVVAKELSDLDYPWNLKAIEERIVEYSSVSEAINLQLSARVMQNYNDFVSGMQMVQSVETELSLIGVLIKNGRRKLQIHDQGILRGSMQITRQQRRRERLKELLSLLDDLQSVVEIHARLCESIDDDRFAEAIVQHSVLRDALASAEYRRFPGVVGLQQSMANNLTLVQQKLSDRLRVSAVSADFDAEKYEEVLKAYSLLTTSDQAISVGKELLRHVSEFIVAVSRQCMLAFSSRNESPDWHKRAQLRELCKSMDPAHVVACIVQLYEHLCNFLYRHQFLCAWHLCRSQAAEEELAPNEASFRELLRHVRTELVASKRNVWQSLQQQVSLVLMTLDFQYPALSEESFMQILHLTQLLMDEGDAFMADYQSVTKSELRRQWSAPIRNTLKTKANDYFQSLHFCTWAQLKASHIEQDSWQRLPVARNYRLLRAERLKPVLPKTEVKDQLKPRSADSNPFRNYKAEPLNASQGDHADDFFEASPANLGESPDDMDDHVLLQHWIDDRSLGSKPAAGLLSNSNRSPVVSASSVELAKVLERYCRMMGAIPSLALDIFQCVVQLMEFYVHCVLCLFVQDKHLRLLLEDLDGHVPAGDPRLPGRQDAFLNQRLFPELRRSTARTREMVSSLPLPDACAGYLQVQAPVMGNALLQVTPFSSLTSPSQLCGLAERCVGVESVRSLLTSLQERRDDLVALLPKDVAQEAVDRFFQAEEVVASQLRSFVLMNAARDVWEVPDVGRISLDHFSNTVQALRWEANSFITSPAAPYVQNLKGQIEELARRIPCAGGGSIPFSTQCIFWGWLEVRLMQECLEVLAKCGRRKTPEALMCLAEDFRSIHQAVEQHFRPQDGDSQISQDVNLLPPDHAFRQVVNWSYLDQFLEAHGYTGNEVSTWCRSHVEYPLRLHKALLDYSLGNNQKSFRQTLNDVEAVIATAISDEGGSLLHHF